MRHGRLITTALVAIAAMAIGPAWAAAAPSPVIDDAITDFAAPGTQATDTWAVEPGTVRLKPTGSPSVADNFDALDPAAWTVPASGATVSLGTLTLDAALVSAKQAFVAPTVGAPQTLVFRATFGSDENQHVGLGADLTNGPWAIFSTGPGGSGLFVRTKATAVGNDVPGAVSIPGFVAAVPHTYRIEWSSTGVTYYVDDVLVTVAAPSGAVAGPMSPIASDLIAAGNTIKIDWLSMGSSPSNGTFVSRVLAADDAHTLWGAVKETGLGSGATFETRSGKNPTFDSTWSNWEPVGSAGAIQSPSGRQYIQYKATLNSATASLDKVAIDYTIDNTAPSAAINSVDVGGTSASVSFSSPDSDIAGFECSLDGGAFAVCTSPNALTGLAAGSHTASVQAIDKAANVGTPVSRTFSIANPPASGGATQQPSGGSSAVDTTAPKVSVVAKSLRASKKGTVSFRVGCPATETSCKVTLKLKNGTRSAASKTVTVKRGKTVTITLTLNKATRQLLKHGSLKVTAVYTATDAAGNHKTTTKRMTLSKAAA